MKSKTVQQVFWGLAVLGSATFLQAQDSAWADKMFEKLELDFGVVAKGAETKMRVAFTNKYIQTVHISSATTACGCFHAKPSKDTIASRETAYIEVTVDTVKFEKQRDSSMTIRFDQPVFAEVRIPLKGYIRTDVVLTPGAAQFGPVAKGKDVDRRISVAYAGRDNWTIKDIISKNKNVVATATQTSRGNGRVNYDLVVKLKSGAPQGDLREQVTLVTDDPGNPYIPVLVEGRVEAEYTVYPELVSFGNLAPGDRKTLNIVVRGRKPFAIDKIESEKSAGTFEIRLPQEAKETHVLPLTLIAPSEAGTLTEEFTVTINGSSEPVTFKAYGKIVAPSSGQTPTETAGATTAQTEK